MMSRRAFAFAALAAPAATLAASPAPASPPALAGAGALPSLLLALDPTPEAQLVAAWASRMTDAITKLQAALAAEDAACRRATALEPPVPGELLYSEADAQLGLTGGTALGAAGLLCGADGKRLKVVTARNLERRAEQLAGLPDLAETLRDRMTIARRWEQAIEDAARVSGFEAAYEARYAAKVALEELLDRLFDEANGVVSLAPIAARGMRAFASLSDDDADAAADLWGNKLAVLLTGESPSPPGAAPLLPLASALPMLDADPWVRLAAERRSLIQAVNDCAYDAKGNIPDDVASQAWGRSAEIDAEIASSLPHGPQGLRAALEQYGSELRDGYGLDEAVTLALFSASIALTEGRTS